MNKPSPKTPLEYAALRALQSCLDLKESERLVIIANPEPDSQDIAWALYHQAVALGAKVTLLTQEARGSQENTEIAILGALKTEPDAFISLSTDKLGRDPLGSIKPYLVQDFFAFDRHYNHISQYLIEGKRVSRGFWCPGISSAEFTASVDLDYEALRRDGQALAGICEKAEEFRLTAPGGTDLQFSLKGRSTQIDLGDYTQAGKGGNLPVGEIILCPVLGSAEGTMVLDSWLDLPQGQSTRRVPLNMPLKLTFESGRLVAAQGELAEALEEALQKAEEDCLAKEDAGQLAVGLGHLFKDHVRSLGDIGLGLNPKVLLEEHQNSTLLARKALGAARMTLGKNSAGDQPSLLAIDGMLKGASLEKKSSGGWELLWGQG
jgi:aminopeptidase